MPEVPKQLSQCCLWLSMALRGMPAPANMTQPGRQMGDKRHPKQYDLGSGGRDLKSDLVSRSHSGHSVILPELQWSLQQIRLLYSSRNLSSRYVWFEKMRHYWQQRPAIIAACLLTTPILLDSEWLSMTWNKKNSVDEQVGNKMMAELMDAKNFVWR